MGPNAIKDLELLKQPFLFAQQVSGLLYIIIEVGTRQ